MRPKRARGFTLVELLAAVMIIGLLALTGLGLTSILAQAVNEDEVRTDVFERRLRAVRTLRADAARATDAMLSAGHVELVGPGTAASWGVRRGTLVRLGPGDDGPCDANAVRVERLANGRLVLLDVQPWGRVAVRVGGHP